MVVIILAISTQFNISHSMTEPPVVLSVEIHKIVMAQNDGDI